MNVLHINQSYEIKGGTEVYIHQLEELLPKHGVCCFFIAVENTDSSGKFDFRTKGVELFKQTEQEIKRSIADHVRDNDVDVIHIHSISHPFVVEFCLGLKPVVRTMHEPRLFCPGRQKFFMKTETICTKPFGFHCCIHAYTQLCQDSRQPKEIARSYQNVHFELNEASKQYKYLLSMSDYIKEEAVLAGVDENKIIVNPAFTPRVESTDPYISNDDASKKVLFVGRLHVSKGIHILLMAVKNLLRDNKITLDIVGDGQFRSELDKMILDEGLNQDNINFYGWLNHDEIINKMKESYLVVFPSIYPEAFGLVGIEAMMCGKPVVAFDVGGVKTWLRDNETGFLVDVKNKSQLEKKIEILLNNEKKYVEFSERARKIAEENFTPERHVSKLIEIYKDSIN